MAVRDMVASKQYLSHADLTEETARRLAPSPSSGKNNAAIKEDVMNFRNAYTITRGFSDPNEVALNRYLDKYDREESMADWIAKRVEELLTSEYDPFRPENVNEAMGDMSKEDLAAFALALKLHAYSVACTIQVACIKAYWQRQAEFCAGEDYEKLCKEMKGEA